MLDGATYWSLGLLNAIKNEEKLKKLLIQNICFVAVFPEA